jgi:hypothetical protein
MNEQNTTLITRITKNKKKKKLTGLVFDLWDEHGVEWKAEKCERDVIMWLLMERIFRHRVICIFTRHG